jgi:hypothetical protein
MRTEPPAGSDPSADADADADADSSSRRLRPFFPLFAEAARVPARRRDRPSRPAEDASSSSSSSSSSFSAFGSFAFGSHCPMTPSAGQKSAAALRTSGDSQLASGTPRMFTHCPSAPAGAHEHRHDPVYPSLGSASLPPFLVALARRSACTRRASSIALWRVAAANADPSAGASGSTPLAPA